MPIGYQILAWLSSDAATRRASVHVRAGMLSQRPDGGSAVEVDTTDPVAMVW